MGGGPRLDRQARIQIGRVHFGVCSTLKVKKFGKSQKNWKEIENVEKNWEKVENLKEIRKKMDDDET